MRNYVEIKVWQVSLIISSQLEAIGKWQKCIYYDRKLEYFLREGKAFWFKRHLNYHLFNYQLKIFLIYFWDISGLYFPVFRLNTEICVANIRLQSEYRKIRTRKNSLFGQFSCSDLYICIDLKREKSSDWCTNFNFSFDRCFLSQLVFSN